jgi:hypothetical protein
LSIIVVFFWNTITFWVLAAVIPRPFVSLLALEFVGRFVERFSVLLKSRISRSMRSSSFFSRVLSEL